MPKGANIMKKLFFTLIMSIFLMGMGWIPYAPDEQPNPPAEQTTASDALPHAPILMIHGLFGNPVTWNRLQSWLEDQGYDRSLMYAPQVTDNFSMCSLAHIEQIEDEIDLIRSETGAEKVTLIGHSRGGTAIMAFMRFSPDNDLVDNVITLAGANHYYCDMVYGRPPSDDTPGDALYTSIYTVPTDGVVPENMAKLSGAHNVEYTDLSHGDYILTEAVFEDVLEALKGAGSN
jgi:pimeloyl-ACP methyl ester carboxylesterase